MFQLFTPCLSGNFMQTVKVFFNIADYALKKSSKAYDFTDQHL